MTPRIQRRSVLSAATAGFFVSHTEPGRAAHAGAGLSVLKIKTISLQPDRYHGWPTLIRRRTGELLVVCSGGREKHVCPFGRVELIRSRDNGDTWTYARTICDGPIDDREPGL